MFGKKLDNIARMLFPTFVTFTRYQGGAITLNVKQIVAIYDSADYCMITTIEGEYSVVESANEVCESLRWGADVRGKEKHEGKSCLSG